MTAKEFMDMEIYKVWDDNFEREMEHIEQKIESYLFMAVDTEFTGFLRRTPRNASQEELYDDVKYNVDRMRTTQIGISLFDSHGNSGGTWQFHLRKHPGVNFWKNQREGTNKEGVDASLLAEKLKKLMTMHMIKWVTFHGIYDLALIMKLVTGFEMPYTPMDFVQGLSYLFFEVYDVKIMARDCQGLRNPEIGLEGLGKFLNATRIGEAHQAGSDSLLTAKAFVILKNEQGMREENYQGWLYGIDVNLEEKSYPLPVPVPVPVPEQYVAAPPPRLAYQSMCDQFQLVSLVGMQSWFDVLSDIHNFFGRCLHRLLTFKTNIIIRVLHRCYERDQNRNPEGQPCMQLMFSKSGTKKEKGDRQKGLLGVVQFQRMDRRNIKSGFYDCLGSINGTAIRLQEKV